MRTLLAAALLALSTAAAADTYRVDVLVFLDKSESAESGRRFELPDLGKSLNLDNAAALKAAGITLLPEDQFGLANEWQRLKTAKRYQPLVKLAWLQDDPPADRRVSLHLSWGETMAINDGGSLSSGLVKPVDGTIALLLGNYLNLDADLIYTQRTESGAVSYRLREKRRVKRDELHHLDSPKLGLLARVSKLAPAKN